MHTYRFSQERNSQEPFLKEQFTLCFQASDSAARLATENDREKWDVARREFWRLYYGPLCIVEDKLLESAMVRAGNLIPKPEEPVPDNLPIISREYRSASIDLAHQARRLIQNAWGIDLGPLAD